MQFPELRILSRSIIQELKQSNLPVNPSRENHLESPAKCDPLKQRNATMAVQRCQIEINFKKVFLYREHLLTY